MGAPSSRVSELAKYWVKNGENVTVITGMPNHPDGIVHPTYKWEYFKEEKTFGVRVLRVFLYATANKGVAKRIISFLSFMITSLIVGILKSETDIVIATSPQLFVGLSGLIIARLKRKPFIFEVRDIWPQSAVELGVIKNKTVIKAMEKLECLLYAKSAMIVVAVKGMKKIIQKKNVDINKIHFIPNGIDVERFSMQGRETLRKKAHLKNKFLIGYIGTIGMAHGLTIIPKAAEKLTDTDVHFIIIGDGAERDNIDSMIKAKNLQNVTLMDKMPREQIPAILKELDLGLVHLKNFPLMQNAVPSKIYEIMAAGKPVLAGISGIGSDFIKENNLGFVFEQENADSLAQTIRDVLKSRHVLNDMGERGRELAYSKYDRKMQALKYLSYIRDKINV